MKTLVTRTYNPLQFSSLEPKRFEDLIRQLTYDFKPWRQLEPTGRAGSDDGFDIRGYEIVSGLPTVTVDLPDGDEEIPDITKDRLWLIQCKREQTITPGGLITHLDALHPDSIKELHGLIFVACCDFSKKSFDVFRAWCSAKGIEEAYLWGKATIEDMLYQPKNDHLLFAYFGISLQIRRQALTSQIKRTIAIKRKLEKIFPPDDNGTPALLRDWSDQSYPYATQENFKSKLWEPRYCCGIEATGLRVMVKSHPAFVKHNEDSFVWDIASLGLLHVPTIDEGNVWEDIEKSNNQIEAGSKLRSFMRSMNSSFQYKFVTYATIPFEDIIDVDTIGHGDMTMPTVFMNFRNGRPPYKIWNVCWLVPQAPYRPSEILPEDNNVNFFPNELRDFDWQARATAQGGIIFSDVPYTPDPQRSDESESTDSSF